MLTIILGYTAISLATLGFLSRMILTIGRMIGDCPQSGAAARSAAVTIATGYSAIGAGGVLIIAAALPALHENSTAALLAALGLAAICLGLGFTHAVTTLRAVVDTARTPPQPTPGTS